MSVATTYRVSGMTCGHCVASVQREVGRLAHVTAVEVDLATGAVAVQSTEELQREHIAEAIEEAGYELIG